MSTNLTMLQILLLALALLMLDLAAEAGALRPGKHLIYLRNANQTIAVPFAGGNQ